MSYSINNIAKSRKHILSLLDMRGFDISEYNNLSLSVVNDMYQANQLDMLVTNPKTQQKAYIKYHINKTLRYSNITEYIDDLFEYDAVLKKTDDLIIITKDKINQSLEKNLKQLWGQDKILITVINIKALQFNIMEHDLIPHHKVLCLDEAEQLKKKYNIKQDSQLPNISRFDPVALALSLRPGQICEITRKSKTAINVPFYRICSV